MATSSESYVGIDVSKDRLDVAVLGERQEKQADNTSQGITQLVEWMQELQPELIVVEATGGYQRAVVEAVFWAGLAVAVVNPARVRQFARACGLLAKTDKLDAQVLAVFGEKVQPRRYESKSEAGKQLSALLVRRRQLDEMLKAEQNRLRTISQSLRGSVERIIKSKGGRGDVRSVLYMSTLVATRYNPIIRAQYQHLLKRGKLKKVALIACMRKFLTILNAMLRDKQPFRCAIA
jgi:transposase